MVAKAVNSPAQDGIQAIAPRGDRPPRGWDITFRTNIHAMFYLTKAAVPHMRPGAAIINTTSINADAPSPHLLAYATTKGRSGTSPAAWRSCSLRRSG